MSDNFNPEQQKAIDSPLGQDVLIAAGAGSGKTKTLSRKVYKICADFAVPPSQILVLTFTNKAAFEMKERIVAEFRRHSNSSLSEEILSSHIQTFDSFSLYLVQQYARYLGVPTSISIMDSSLLEAKSNAELDAIFQEYYRRQDPSFLSLLSHQNVVGDRETKRLVLTLSQKLGNLLPSEREDFVRRYDEKFLSDAFLHGQFYAFLDDLRDELKTEMKKAVAFYRLFLEGLERSSLAEEIDHLDLEGIDLNQRFGAELLDRLWSQAQIALESSEEELEKQAEFYSSDEGRSLFSARGFPTGEFDENEKTALKKAFYIVRDALLNSFYRKIKNVGSFERQRERLLSFRDDIHLLFEIVEDLQARMERYKFLSNAYSFQDIANMALSLLIDPRYHEACEAIQNRFRYVLVDEYQDTNDFQEAFLNALSKKATLFTVGDAKQSIYGFRNSNCQLFLDRKERYEKEGKDERIVIEMNKNYRSVEKVLDDVNAIFENYMSLEHGGIRYEGKERLEYDRKADLFSLARTNPKGEYGLWLLRYDNKVEGRGTSECECRAICQDIREKIESGYQVLDFGKDGLTLRPCTYKDFAILIRKRTDFPTYQKVFLDEGIPLNEEIATGFHDIDVILVLQTLVRLFSHLLGATRENLSHLYLSLARSYLFGKAEGYDDKRIDRVLREGTIEQDPLLLRAKAFVQAEKDQAFSRIFLDMVQEFRILEKLPLLGDVSNNVSKIETYYRFLVSQESIGEGLLEFVNLFKVVDKYDVGFSASSVTSLENAVSLMTIHQSKGLEFKVVYMPLTRNDLSSAKNESNGPVLFSRQLGLLPVDYGYNECSETFLNRLYEKGEGSRVGEESEHVRLFYVALTRAKETLYIVGNPEDFPRKRPGSLYDMLDATYHYQALDERIFSRYRSLFSKQDLQAYSTLLREAKDVGKRRKELLAEKKAVEKAVFAFLFDSLIAQPLQEEIHAALENFALSILDHLLEQAGKDERTSIRLLIRFYLQVDPGMDIEGFCKQNKESLKKHLLSTDMNSLKDEAKLFLDALQKGENNEFLRKHKAIRKCPFPQKNVKKLSEEDFLRAKKSALLSLLLSDLLSFVDGEGGPVETTVYPLFSRKTLPLCEEAKEREKHVLPELTEDKREVSSSVVEHRRASKFLSDEETIPEELVSKGTLFHRYMEVVDLRTKDVSIDVFECEEDRRRIRKVLSLPLFSHLEDAQIYREYRFDDREGHAQGSIDLLLLRPDEVDVVDYKLKHLDDPAYVEQLRTYRRNVERLFPGKKVRTFLLSLFDARLQEIDSSPSGSSMLD